MVSCIIIIFYILSLIITRTLPMMTSSPGASSVLPAPFHNWHLHSQDFTDFGTKIQNTTWSRRPPITPIKIHHQQPNTHHIHQQKSKIHQHKPETHQPKPKTHLQKPEIHQRKTKIYQQKVEARRRYNNYKDHYYQPKNVMACIPKVERLCKNVFRAVKVVRDVQRCFDVSTNLPNLPRCKLVKLEKLRKIQKDTFLYPEQMLPSDVLTLLCISLCNLI